MKKITLNKKDVYQIINEEIIRFSEQVEQAAIVDNFAKKFTSVFIESLDLSSEEKKIKISNELETFIKKYKKEILESIVDPNALTLKEQHSILSKHSDREITKLIESTRKSLTEAKLSKKEIELDGDLFYGEEDTSLRLAEYKGREVFLNIPFSGANKRYKMFVQVNGIVEKIEFGKDPMSFRKTPANSKQKAIWVCKNWNLNENTFPKPSDQFALKYVNEYSDKNGGIFYNLKSVYSDDPVTARVTFQTDNGPNSMDVWWVKEGSYGYNDGMPINGTSLRLYGEW